MPLLSSIVHSGRTDNPHAVTAAQAGAVPDVFSMGARDVAFGVVDRGQVSVNQTLDVTQNNWLRIEPTADIMIDFTNVVDANGNRRVAVVEIVGGGDHTLSYTVNGAGTVTWNGDAPSLSTGAARDMLAVSALSASEVLVSLAAGGY